MFNANTRDVYPKLILKFITTFPIPSLLLQSVKDKYNLVL